MILNSLLRATKGARHVFLVSGTPFTLWRIPEAVHILGMSEPAWKALESSGRKKERTPLARTFFLAPTTSKRLLRRLGMPKFYWLICMEYGREAPGVEFKVRLMSP